MIEEEKKKKIKPNQHNSWTAFKILHKSQLVYISDHHHQELQSVADGLLPRRPQLIKKGKG